MAETLKNMLSLTDALLSELTTDSHAWESFLVFSARLYKYPFAEQVLIYGQRPDATACAPIEIWNHRMHRWVNRYAKGIALLDDSQNRLRLKYVFDLSDTHPGRDAKLPYLWVMQEAYHDVVRNQMTERWDVVLEDGESFFESLEHICMTAVYEHLEEFAEDFSNASHDYEDEALLQLLSESVMYAVASRCGLKLPQYEFPNLASYRTFEEISVLGTAVSEVSKGVLTEIRQIVATIEQMENNRNFAELPDEDYTEHRLENETFKLQIKEEEYDERDYVPSGRGVSVSGSDRTDGGDHYTEQIWPDVQAISAGTSEGPVSSTAVIGESVFPLTTDGRYDESTTRPADERAGTEGRHRRSDERSQSDEMGRMDEQYQASSRGIADTGTAVEAIQREEQASSPALPPFFVEEKDALLSEAVDLFLRSGANEKQSALRICGQYRKGKRKEENIAFLRQEFGNGCKGILVEDRLFAFSFSYGGVWVAEGSTAIQGSHREIYWSAIEERVALLLEHGRYLTVEQLMQVDGEERTRIAEALYSFYRDLPKEVKGRLPLDTSGSVPVVEERLAEQLSKREQIQAHLAFFDTLPAVRREQKKKQLKQALEDLLLEPIEFPIAKENLPKPSLFITEDAIDEILQRGSMMEGGKYRIYIFFQNEPELKARASFLKKEYGIGGYSHSWRSVMADGKGISISQSTTSMSQPYEEKLLSWEQVARRIERLIDTDRYIQEDELDLLADYLGAQDAVRQWDAIEEPSGDVEAYGTYEIGSQVYIGAKLYEIGDITNDIVYLYDSERTLFPMEYSRQDFEKQIEENPLNQVLHRPKVPKEPVLKVKPAERVEPFHPSNEKVHYRITDETLGHGGAKEKYRANMDAIRLLKTLEEEQRFATTEEQDVLARYVGWGSLPMAFDETNAAWSKEYEELKTFLTEKEYKEARASTLNAHYTSPVIIKAMYQGLERLGFRFGNVLEPACGVGNFFGLLPESMREANLYGVELESIAGRLAKALYPNATVTISGFEETNYPDNFFDVAIGNVPFGPYQVRDKRYDHLKFSIHDYFFAKALDQVRPNGVLAFITSHYTMDKQTEDVRRYLAQRAELLGAIRLPNDAFKANAGAEVVVDILFLQKRERPVVADADWVGLGQTDDGFILNQYFVDHPDMVLGKLQMATTQYGREECTCSPVEGESLAEQLQQAIANIHGSIDIREAAELSEEETSIPADPTVQNFSYTIVDQKLYYRENSRMYPISLSDSAMERMKAMMEIRDCVRQLIAVQMEDVSDSELETYQKELNWRYDQFQAAYGLLNDRANQKAFRDDSSYPLLCSLEHLDEQGNLKRKADIFTKRTIRAYREYQKAETANEALLISLTEKATVDLPYMAELLGEHISLDTIKEELRGVIFKEPLLSTPEQEVWQTADEYLSGDVRKKLKVAEFSAEGDPSYQVNVEALKRVQPVELSAADIDVRLGTTWIPADVIQDFVYELLKTPHHVRKDIRVLYLERTAEWQITHKSFDRGNVQANTTYGTERANAYRIIEDSLNLRDVRVYDYEVDLEGRKRAILNKDETVIAQGKQSMIKQAFQDWVWQDQERRSLLVERYNQLYNSVRPRNYDGSHLLFPGMNPEIQLRQHQKDAVARILYGGNALLAHVVGAGKSATRS